MAFMKNRKKLTTICIAAAIVAVVAIILGLTLLGNDELWTSVEYDYQSHKPMTDEPDEWMMIDGRLTEDVWKNKNWLEYSTNGVTFAVTTDFTEKGLYMAGKAQDPYIYYNALYDYSNSSSFTFTIIREDEKAVNVNSDALYRPCRRAFIKINPKDYNSLSNVRVNVATSVQGPINTPQESVYHETQSWSFEMFISWDSLRLEDEYFMEDGIPEALKIYTQYRSIDGENENKINLTLRPLNTQSHRYDSFWTFNRDGLVRDSSSAILGDAVGGPAASDQLTYTVAENGELEVTSEVNRTQMTWARNPKSENFMIEATFKTNSAFAGSGTYGMGFILYSLPQTGRYNIFTVNADELQSGTSLGFTSAEFVDSLQYLSSFSIKDTVSNDYVSPYGAGMVHLKLVKVGGYMYYFVDNAFYKMEFIDELSGAVSAGLFFNYPGTATDYRFEDYTDNVDALMAELKEQAYFITVPGVTSYGSVTADNLAVPKGDPITLTINPNSGYVPEDIQVNGVSVLQDIKEGSYKFTPTADVKVTAKFHKLDSKAEANKLSLGIVDEAGESLNGVTFTLIDKNGKVRYAGVDNGRGKVIITVPRQCTVAAGDDGVAFSGEYTLRLYKDGYMREVYQLNLGETESLEQDFVMRKFQYGSVSLNGKKTTDIKNTFEYDEAKKLYFHPATTKSGYARAYNGAYVATDYVFTAKITSEAAKGTMNVPGVSISTGEGSTIDLKVSGTANRLYIYCGTKEISVTGFNHNHTAKGGTATFSVVRKGANIYVFDADGRLGVVLNKAGIQAVGDHKISGTANLSSVAAAVSKFFKTPGMKHTVGILNHYNVGSAATYYNINWTDDAQQVDSWLRRVSYVTLMAKDNIDIASAKFDGAHDAEKGFVVGSTASLLVKSAVEKKSVESIVLCYADGSKEAVALNAYSGATETSTFTFIVKKAVSDVEYKLQSVYKISGVAENAEGPVAGAEITFVDQHNGIKHTATSGKDGSYSVTVFPSTYDVLAVQGSQTAVAQSVTVNENITLDMNMATGTYYLGSVKVNDKKVSSSSVVNVNVNVDGADGSVTIPANNSALSAVLSNQVYNGGDSFTYTIRVSGDMAVSSGTNGADAQIGFGLTDGTNWWVFYIKGARGQGKNIGIGLTTHGKGGGDYFYTTVNSPNSIVNNGTTLTVDAVLTIEKTGDKLTLYAGSGDSKVELFTATAEGYKYTDGAAKISNVDAEAAHVAKLASFFDAETEIALCLASFMYNAGITFQITVE